MLARRYILLLAALSAVLFFFQIGMPLTDGDTAYYGKIARNILETGDWLTLHYLGDDFVDKPPLSIWPMAISYRIFGFHDWATRGWHSLLAIGCVLLVFAIALRFVRPLAAFLGALVFATSFLFFYMAQVPQQDVPLLFFSLLAFLAFIRHRQDRRVVDWLVFFAATGLAFLTRGLQGAVFPFGSVILFLGLRKLLPPRGADAPARGRGLNREKKDRLSVLLWPAGVAVFAIVAVPWYYLEYVRHGPSFLNYFFGAGNARYYSNISDDTSLLASVSYVPMVLLALLPWSGYLYHAVRHALRAAFRVPTDDGNAAARAQEAILFFGAWFLVAFTLPLMIRWRVIRYLLPAIPPLAIMIGGFFAHQIDLAQQTGRAAAFRRGSFLTLCPVFLLGLTVILAYTRFPQAQQALKPVLLPFLITYAVTMATAALLAVTRGPRLSVAAMVIGAALSYLLLWSQIGRFYYLADPWLPPVRAINARIQPDDRVLHIGEGPVSFVHYYVEHPVLMVNAKNAARILAENAAGHSTSKRSRRFFLIADGKRVASLRRDGWIPSLTWREFPGGKVLAIVDPTNSD